MSQKSLPRARPPRRWLPTTLCTCPHPQIAKGRKLRSREPGSSIVAGRRAQRCEVSATAQDPFLLHTPIMRAQIAEASLEGSAAPLEEPLTPAEAAKALKVSLSWLAKRTLLCGSFRQEGGGECPQR
jgi:hypothetical protein